MPELPGSTVMPNCPSPRSDEGDETRIVVSEPLGELVGAWQPVPESSYGVVQDGSDVLGDFRPRLP